MNKKTIISLKLLFILIFSCIGWSTLQNNPFVFQRDNQKVVLEIENGKEYLIGDIKAKLKLKTENINPQKLSLSAPGLRLLLGANDNNNESLWEILPKKQNIKNDTLILSVVGRDLKDSIWVHKFKILVK
ncbi:MAG TPA: hypothetical protein VLB74_06990 [Flavobacterium sp.]|uniref:hypothetical protein n=1 Tax=Flavobacterium sp. TaxID=239 RepID=UPI002C36E7D2|nr:hypothetical protein [Flavobacterium sp.]HSD14377.1 hypothetical protein [Flavobacterium sp.]